MHAAVDSRTPDEDASGVPAPSLPRAATRELFRPEVSSHTETRSAFGPVLALTPVSLRLFAALVALTVALLVAFAALVPISRHEGVEGTLAASGGTITLRDPGEGVVSELHVRPGDRVAAGQTLAAVRLARTGDVARGAQRAAYDNLLEERRLQGAATEQARQLALHEILDLGERHAGALERVALLEERSALLEDIVTTERRRLARVEALHAQGDVSAAELEEARIVEQRTRQESLALREELLAATEEARDLARGIVARERRREADAVAARRERLATETRLDELDTPEVVLLESPVDGIVSGVNLREGQSTGGGEGLLRIMPSGGELLARFVVPSRAVGLIEPGQSVKLRFDPFPHERYGSQRGTLRSVTPAVAVDAAGAGPAAPFVIDVALENDAVRVGDTERPLLPDMGVSGSIELERRTLLGWAVAPLVALRERL